MIIRLRTKGIRDMPIRNMLKEYNTQARAAMIAATVISLITLTSIRERIYSAGLKGLAKRFNRFFAHTSSRKETDMPCCDRNRISQRIKAPRKKVIKPGKLCLN